MTTKKVGYAYPSSSLANELGKPNGCYYVKVGHNDSNPLAMSDFISAWDTIQDALREAENLNAPYYRWSLTPASEAKRETQSKEIFIRLQDIGGIK